MAVVLETHTGGSGYIGSLWQEVKGPRAGAAEVLVPTPVVEHGCTLHRP